MKNFLVISFTFLIALLLEILPLPTWAVWLRPEWVVLVLIFWVLTLPYNVSVMIAFCLGLLMDLLMGVLLGEHAAAFVVITYFVSRFHARIRLFPTWQQSVMIFFWMLIYQVYLLWMSGLSGGLRSNSWFWLPALITALIWPWVYMTLKSYSGRYRMFTLRT